MIATLECLAVLGGLGAIDTLYFHEYRGHLPAQHGGIDTELKLHAGRDAVYVIVFGTLPWVVWSGGFAVALVLLLLIEIVLTMTDFVVEDRVRGPLGGVCPGERVLHGLMAIVYGGMLISLAPTVVGWIHGPTRLEATPSATPLWLGLLLSSMAAGIAISGARDCFAAHGVALASWPWQMEPPRASTQGETPGAGPASVPQNIRPGGGTTAPVEWAQP